MMRAKFIRGQNSKKAMKVGKHRIKDGFLEPREILNYSNKFLEDHPDLNKYTGTLDIIYDYYYSQTMDRGNYYEFKFSNYIISIMKKLDIYDEYKEKLLDILIKSNTNYEFIDNSNSELGKEILLKLMINIKND